MEVAGSGVPAPGMPASAGAAASTAEASATTVAPQFAQGRGVILLKRGDAQPRADGLKSLPADVKALFSAPAPAVAAVAAAPAAPAPAPMVVPAAGLPPTLASPAAAPKLAAPVFSPLIVPLAASAAPPELVLAPSWARKMSAPRAAPASSQAHEPSLTLTPLRKGSRDSGGSLAPASVPAPGPDPARIAALFAAQQTFQSAQQAPVAQAPSELARLVARREVERSEFPSLQAVVLAQVQRPL
jgi:ribonuclease E